MGASMMFCCRLPDVNEVLLQIIDAVKFTPDLSRLKIARKINKISIIKHNKIFLLNYSFTFNFLSLGYVQFEAKFMVFMVYKFCKVK